MRPGAFDRLERLRQPLSLIEAGRRSPVRAGRQRSGLGKLRLRHGSGEPYHDCQPAGKGDDAVLIQGSRHVRGRRGFGDQYVISMWIMCNGHI